MVMQQTLLEQEADARRAESSVPSPAAVPTSLVTSSNDTIPSLASRRSAVAE